MNLLKSEITRKKLIKQKESTKIKFGFFCFIFAVFASFLINQKFHNKTFLIFILSLFCGYFLYKFLLKKLNLKFQKTLQNNLIDTFFIPLAKEFDGVFLPQCPLDFEIFARSELLSKDINFISSNGTISLKNSSLNLVTIKENFIAKKPKFSLKNIFSKNKERILFDGIASYHNFEVVCEAKFFILPKGEIPTNTKKFNSNFANFNEIYDVFTNDEDLAKEILDEKFCNFCIKICEEFAVCLKISFLYGRIYLFIDCGEILPDFNENLNKNSQLLLIEEILQNFELLNFKISQLNIWQNLTKQPELEEVLNIAKSNSWDKLL